MPKIVVVIPTYNEADNLKKITSAMFELLIDDLEILIVDDASPDGTGQIAEQIALEHPGKLHVMHRPGKTGLGTAYIEGFRWAIGEGAGIIIHMDADFSHSPGYIPEMLQQISEYDIVVGSRYVKGGSVDERWSWYRRLLSWWANSVWVRIILGTKTNDATAGFKCWRAEVLEGIGLDRICSNGYVFHVEMCYLSEKLDYRIKEIPIYFEDRRIGQTKMDNQVKLEAALRVFDIRRRHKNLHASERYVHG